MVLACISGKAIGERANVANEAFIFPRAEAAIWLNKTGEFEEFDQVLHFWLKAILARQVHSGSGHVFTFTLPCVAHLVQFKKGRFDATPQLLVPTTFFSLSLCCVKVIDLSL